MTRCRERRKSPMGNIHPSARPHAYAHEIEGRDPFKHEINNMAIDKNLTGQFRQFLDLK